MTEREKQLLAIVRYGWCVDWVDGARSDVRTDLFAQLQALQWAMTAKPGGRFNKYAKP